MKNRIEKQIELKVPPAVVWDALTNYEKFGEWFRVKWGEPFVLGQTVHGQLTYPGYEQHIVEIVIQKMDTKSLFSFSWHPYAVDINRDYSSETPTLVEFRLKANGQRTELLITESGFDKISEDRRAEAFRMNDQGWNEQMQNIKHYVEQSYKNLP